MHFVTLFFAVATAIAIIWITLRRRVALGATSLIIFALSLAVGAIGYVFFRMDALESRLVWLGVTYLGMTVTPTAMFTFALQYTNRDLRLTWRKVALLSIEPIATQVLLWTNTYHGLFFGEKDSVITPTTFSGGLWVWANAIYGTCLAVAALLLLIRAFIHYSLSFRLPLAIVITGTLVPILIGFVILAGYVPFSSLHLMLLAFTVTGLILAFGLFHYQLLDIVPISRDIIVENMGDGWMALDSENRIVDLNPRAEELLGTSREKIFGLPVEKVLDNWEDLMLNDNARVIEQRGSILVGDERRYLSVRISPLVDQSGHKLGKIIVWRDTTERRKADDARQHARNEMFVLLHLIARAATRALNLKDFLTETICQIVYSFHSQVGVFFMVNESNDKSESLNMSLAAYHGLSREQANNMETMLKSSELVTLVLKNHEPLLISDPSTDPRIPAPMQQAGYKSLLIMPMTSEGLCPGVIVLARNEGPVYNADEMIRLNVIADEIAGFIYSDRERELVTTMAERHRLERDLHDAVTAKLYGLLTLTEAAQAGLEAGATDMPARALPRIGDYARQALREMRLFLYELLPVDLEHEGLVATLNQRLATVEGRSNIKVGLLADDNISLPPSKELELYHIAQEALNNILRYANAKTVTMRLIQTKVNVRLEIEDDGCGFDPKVEHIGGMGLRNMKERASKIEGKLKITSSPGKGTKIVVTTRSSKASSRERRYT